MDINLLTILYLSLLGLIFGSFAGCLSYRLSVGKSVVSPSRSFCPECGTVLAWFDNIPVVSYLVLRGKCRHCGQVISPRYLVLELVMSVCALGLAFAVDSPVSWVLGMGVAFCLTVGLSLAIYPGR